MLQPPFWGLFLWKFNMKFKYKILTTSLLTALSATAVNAQQNPGFAIEDVLINSNGITIAGGEGGTITLTNNGLTAGAVDISSTTGINAGNMKVTNVANATADSDAVNLGQLKTLETKTVHWNAGGGIGNVSDGYVGAGSRDAVNGGQLWEVEQKIQDVNQGALYFAGETGRESVKASETLDIVGSNDNISTSISKNGDENSKLEIALAEDLQLTSVTTGSTVLNNNGLTAGAVNISSTTGINAGGMKITNVADGLVAAGSTDSINGGQLHAVTTHLAEVSSQVDKPLTFSGNTGSTDVKLGNEFAIVGSNSNLSTSITDNQLAIALSDDLNLTSVTTGNTVINDSGVTIAGGAGGTVALTNDGLTAGEVNISSTNGINAGGMKITNVADGTVDSDAVNLGQLKNVVGNLDALSNLAVVYDNSNKDTMTLAGANGTTITNVANGFVAADSTDAVNGSQLHETNEQVANNTASIVHHASRIDNLDVQVANNTTNISELDNKLNENTAQILNTVDQVASSINHRVDNLQRDVSRIDKNASGGTAAAMAMANLPQSWKPGQTGVSASASNYRGQQGYALGISTMSNNGKWVVKGSVAGSSRGSVGAAAGVFYSFN